uniref:Tf2-1-like SH3-like domain-containing protein n=1 Tax=Cajanus cajan TaxID=3821 RepID=A0A151SWY8_CAJCA|nr:hypothetical protein KK1_014725 [Cajanus cajan]
MINPKLSPQYFGSYQIEAHMGEMAYMVQLLDTTRVHRVFHVSQLKRAFKEQATVSTIPPEMEVEDADPVVLETILASWESK